MKTLFTFFLVLLYLALRALGWGFIITYLWLWFAVPFGLEPISLVHAIGLTLLSKAVLMLIPGYEGITDQYKATTVGELIVYALGKELGHMFIFLSFGWILSRFM